MGEVIAMKPPQPKKLNKKYKNTEYIIEYLPTTKQWKWLVTYVSVTKYGDVAKSINAAQKAAEKHIEETLKLRGKL